MELEFFDYTLILIGFLIVAMIYSSIGHAGASGYTAILALFSFTPEFIRPISLTLNIVVGSLGLYRFHQAQLIKYEKVVPFLVGSIPITYIAATLTIDKNIFYFILGGMLLFSSFKLFFDGRHSNTSFKPNILLKWPISIFLGSIIGFISGLTGTGGAIFFTPLILYFNWASPKETSGLSVVFVLTNSIFGLIGICSQNKIFNFANTSPWLLPWIFSVIIGATIGTTLGIKNLSNQTLKRIISLVLFIAGIKLVGLVIS